MTINKKGVKQDNQDLLSAKIGLICNQHPKMLDNSGALAQREIVIKFDKFIPRDKRDKQLTDKLKAELPGIANWCLKGLARLHGRKTATSR